jgi:hypothetical protein
VIVKSLLSLGLMAWLICGTGSGAQAAATPAPPPTPASAAVAPASEPAAAGATKPAEDPSAEAAPPADEETKAGEEGAKPESPYRSIKVRNPFGLRDQPPPPPPPADPSKDAQATASALKLTGIVMLGGVKRATFVTQEPGKPQQSSALMGEGETDDTIKNLEVHQIDMQAQTVRVAYGGKELTVDFKNNGLKAPVVAAVGPGRVPGAPVLPGSVPPPQVGGTMVHSVGQPGGAPNIQPVGTTENPSGLQSIPMRPTRLPVGGSSAMINAYQGAGATVQPTVPPDQQALMMRAQEEISRRQGVSFPPSPPIPGVDFVQPQPGTVGRGRFNIQAPPSLPGMQTE